MTTATVSARPNSMNQRIPVPADDGLFGPESISWRLSAAPAAAVAIPAAVLLQMMHPRVMWMIDQASSFWQYPARRAEGTQQYGLSMVYGDIATAEHAGATLRTIHSRRTAVDPLSGETYRADEPDLLMWVHATIPWAILRALKQWGPHLTPEEQDHYVDEQRVAARLVGLEPESAPGTVAELNAYMASMRPKLAITPGCVRLMELMLPRSVKPTRANLAQSLLGHAALSLLTAEQRRLYGIRWTRLDALMAKRITGALLRMAASKLTVAEQVPSLRAEAMARPFGGRPHLPADPDGAARV